MVGWISDPHGELTITLQVWHSCESVGMLHRGCVCSCMISDFHWSVVRGGCGSKCNRYTWLTVMGLLLKTCWA